MTLDRRFVLRIKVFGNTWVSPEQASVLDSPHPQDFRFTPQSKSVFVVTEGCLLRFFWHSAIRVALLRLPIEVSVVPPVSAAGTWCGARGRVVLRDRLRRQMSYEMRDAAK